MTQQVKTLGRAILCEFPSGDKFLVGEIDIDCPGCGAGQWRIAGHHMRTILRLLSEWVEQYPDLTGATDATVTKGEPFTMRSGGDPTEN